MKTRLLVFIFVVLLAALGLSTRARGEQSDLFIISRADSSATVATIGSQGLNTVLPLVGPRFVVSRANNVKFVSLGSLNMDLAALLAQVGPRFVLQRANANRFYATGFPTGLVNDTSPPQVITVNPGTAGSNTVKITVTTNEYTTLTVELGLQPGVYTQVITINLFLMTMKLL